jgi:hypothetical protein
MESSVEKYAEGDFVAVRSTLYKEKPLIGQITKTGRADIQIDWYIGTYSGTWKPWKGREEERLSRTRRLLTGTT